MRNKKHYVLFFIGLLLIASNTFAQDDTRTAANKDTVAAQLLIIPFEPKMYWSEVDKKINEQTKWSFEQICEYFRKQLDTQLQIKLKGNNQIKSFYTDSTKMWKDLDYTYKSSSLSYDPIDKPTSPIQTNVVKKQIKDGQLQVESSDGPRFMNIKISDAEMLHYFKKKYNAQYILFINQLDIKTMMDSYNMQTGIYQRQTAVHYSLIDNNGKIIIAGVSKHNFSSAENNPKKIAQQCFSAIASEINTSFYNKLHPKAAAQTKK
jgi:hypothetical protein